MKRFVFILVLVLILSSCTKYYTSKESEIKTSEIAKITEEKAYISTVKESEKESQTSIDVTAKFTDSSSGEGKFLSEEDSIKYGKKLNEIFENIKSDRGYPNNSEINTEMIGDLDGDGSVDAIITVKVADRMYQMFYLKLEEDGLDNQIGHFLTYENVDYMGVSIEKIKGSEQGLPVLNVELEGGNGAGFMLYYLDGAGFSGFLNMYDDFFYGYRYLDDSDGDGIIDCYFEDENSAITLGEMVYKKIEFVEHDKYKPDKATATTEINNLSALDTVKTYIKLFYLKNLFLEEGYDVSDFDAKLKEVTSDELDKYLEWNSEILINTFAGFKPYLNFTLGDATVNASGEKVYKVEVSLDGTYYEKYLGDFADAQTVAYELKELENGKFVVSGQKLEDAHWQGMDEVYQTLFLPMRNKDEKFEVLESINLEKGEEINIISKFIYRDENKAIAHIYLEDEDGYILDGSGFDYYFLEQACRLYIMDGLGFDNYMLNGELDDGAMLLFKEPFEKINYAENIRFAGGSVEKNQYEYTCKILGYDAINYVLKFKQGQGLVRFEMLFDDGEAIIKTKVLE